MVESSFDFYWECEWNPSTMPFLMQEAMRHLALKTWNAAVKASSSMVDMKTSELLALVGEDRLSDLNTVVNVLKNRTDAVANLKSLL